jgi:hypothetical protein
VRTFGDWNDPHPGFVEVDFVAHGGGSAAGSFVQTLVLTDIATGWTECVPVLMRNGALVIEALKQARTLFPFPLAGVDFDNDGSFMNEGVVGWCREQELEVTRSRAYRKNDQAWGSRRTARWCAGSSAAAGSRAWRPPARSLASDTFVRSVRGSVRGHAPGLNRWRVERDHAASLVSATGVPSAR